MAVSVAQNLMPLPASWRIGEGRVPLPKTFRVESAGPGNPRLTAAIERAIRRINDRTGPGLIPFVDGNAPSVTDSIIPLVIECDSPGALYPQLGDDESYSLEVTSERVLLRAATTLGAMHGLETLLQLIQSDAQGWFMPELRVSDHPRFPWRGLMIDVCRHWQPMEVIKRNLDGMAGVKLNVLHLHLTDDQGFRIESKTFRRLNEFGSDGHYFTHDEIREIIDFAAARGIRVVPEFDIPGHATSWLAAYPELASSPGSYAVERKWGVFDPVLDPTNPKVYEMLDGFLSEMAGLFPDAYVHVGGDENNGVQWNANAKIQAFIREHNLHDNAGLHAYFNHRVQAIMASHGKKLIGWDEILHPDLPAGSVVQSWRGPEGISAAVQRGYPALLSHGYYIDLCQPAWKHYLNDPAPTDAKLSEAQGRLIWGGEATMWSEWVSPETIDSRIWPRTAAIAERLWSPAEIRDVPDMYRRLEKVSQQLEEVGLKHASYIEPALRQLAGENATETDLRALRLFLGVLEPVKDYARGRYQPDANQFTPLIGLVDSVRPDSPANREFAVAVDSFLAAPRATDAARRVTTMLEAWRAASMHLLERCPVLSPHMSEAESLLHDIAEAATEGEKAIGLIQSGHSLDAANARRSVEIIQRAGKPRAAVEFPASATLEKLVTAAEQGSGARTTVVHQ